VGLSLEIDGEWPGGPVEGHGSVPECQGVRGI